jgi:tetratricopeptide (TPR) repeat protein
MFSGLVFAAGLAVFVSSLRAQTSEDVNGCYKEISPDQAINCCTRAIGAGQLSASNLVIIFTNRGNAYNGEADYDQAIQNYDRAIRLISNYGYAFNGRGNAYNHKGDYDRAIQDYDQAIRLNPNFADAFFNRGFTRFKEGPIAMAVPDFAKSAELVPANRYNILWVYVAAARARQNPNDALLNA